MKEIEQQYLMHYGVKMRSGRYAYGSGDRPYQHINTKGTRSYNIDKWGKSQNNNILYLTGYSGSGKSTKAKEITDKNTQVVHLDLFLEPNNSHNERNKELVKYLKDHKFDIEKMSDTSIDKKERWKYIDQFAEKHLQDFSKQQYKNGNKVIVEGVQLSDQTIFPDKTFFVDKPLMIMKTGPIKSWYRAGIRDQKINRKDLTPQDVKEYINWYFSMYKNMNALEKTITTKEGKNFIEKMFK